MDVKSWFHCLFLKSHNFGAYFLQTFTLHLPCTWRLKILLCPQDLLIDMKNTEISPEEKHGAILIQVASVIQQIKKCQTS